MSIIALIALILSGMVNQASGLWNYTTSKIEQFHAAENAFEAISTRLSQATLNTYWDYQRNTAGEPQKYMRQSDLRFYSSDAETALGSDPPKVSHCIFFTAPLGFVNNPNYHPLENLLNAWGYYVEFDSDKESRPPFLSAAGALPPERLRYRLMEFMQPSEELELYNETTGSASAAMTTSTDWFTKPLAQKSPQSRSHLRAENVIAMILLPKLSVEDDATGTKLAPNYTYDSSPGSSTGGGNPPPLSGDLDQKNQLPPIVQVTLVAIDETSASRLAAKNGTNPPDFNISSLFKNAANYDQDLNTLQKTLASSRVNYRIFTADVAIRGARWSRN